MHLGLSFAWSDPPLPDNHSRFLSRVKKVMSDQSFSRNLEAAGKLSSLEKYAENKLIFGTEPSGHAELETRRAIAIFRLNCRRSLAVKYLADNSKQCELCDSRITDVWVHMLYFCSKVRSDTLPLPEVEITNHLKHFKKNPTSYTTRLKNIALAKPGRAEE